jgi:hypothetical protein
MLREVTSLDVAFLDVPLESVVVVHHDNPAPADSVEKRTWRTIMSGITAERWGQAQLDYMESEIAEKDFGISDARGPLELYSIGGAVGSYTDSIGSQQQRAGYRARAIATVERRNSGRPLSRFARSRRAFTIFSLRRAEVNGTFLSESWTGPASGTAP